MPYITSERKAELEGSWNNLTHGDVNYLITKWIIETWDNNPRYQTIHEIKRAINRQYCDDKLWDLRATLFEHGIADIDFQVAAELAFLEFYRRVAGDYEDLKATSNGDVYYDALDKLMEMK